MMPRSVLATPRAPSRKACRSRLHLYFSKKKRNPHFQGKIQSREALTAGGRDESRRGRQVNPARDAFLADDPRRTIIRRRQRAPSPPRPEEPRHRWLFSASIRPGGCGRPPPGAGTLGKRVPLEAAGCGSSLAATQPCERRPATSRGTWTRLLTTHVSSGFGLGRTLPLGGHEPSPRISEMTVATLEWATLSRAALAHPQQGLPCLPKAGTDI